MGKLIDKVNLNMSFRQVSEIIGNPHKVIIANHNKERIIWQYFNSKGQLEIIFHEGKVHSKTIYLKGELLPDHFNQSIYGMTGSSQTSTGKEKKISESIQKVKKQIDT